MSFLKLHFLNQLPPALGQQTVAESLSITPASGATFPISFSNDTNYGVVGANTLRTAAQIGNATGAAAFGTGADGAQVLRVTLSTRHEDAATPLAGRLSNGTGFADFDIGAPGATTLRTMAMLGVGTQVVSNANPVPISDAGSSLTVDGTVLVSNFPSTSDTNLGSPGASTIRTAAMLGVGSAAVSNGNPVPISDAGGSITIDGSLTNISGTISLPTGAATEATLSTLNGKIANDVGAASGAVRTTPATFATATVQTRGEIVGSSLTGSYATVLSLGADTVILSILNDCNADIFVSLDGGTSDTLELHSGESLVLDLGSNYRKLASGTNIQAKHAGAAPTSGSIRVSRVG